MYYNLAALAVALFVTATPHIVIAQPSEPPSAQGTAPEDGKWAEAASANTIESYRKYLRETPDGKNADDARSRLERLVIAEQISSNPVMKRVITPIPSQFHGAWASTDKDAKYLVIRPYAFLKWTGIMKNYKAQVIHAESVLSSNSRELTYVCMDFAFAVDPRTGATQSTQVKCQLKLQSAELKEEPVGGGTVVGGTRFTVNPATYVLVK